MMYCIFCFFLAGFFVPISAQLTLAIKGDVDFLNTGSYNQLPLTFVVSNSGTFPQSNVKLKSTLPQGTQSFWETPRGGCTALNCDSQRPVEWSLGSLSPGESRTIHLAIPISLPSSGILRMIASVESNESEIQERYHDMVIAASDFALTIEANHNAIQGGFVNLRLGYASVYSITQTQLSLVFPPELTFISATGNPVLTNNLLVWNTGDLTQFSGGRFSVSLSVPANMAKGTVLKLIAEMQKINSSARKQRTSAFSIIGNPSPLNVVYVPATPGQIVSSNFSLPYQLS